jgi:hypothetical protein
MMLLLANLIVRRNCNVYFDCILNHRIQIDCLTVKVVTKMESAYEHFSMVGDTFLSNANSNELDNFQLNF